MHRVRITDTTLRDAHQSLWATRMRTRDMLPIAEKIDAVGYFSLEVWGGATFDVCLRYLGEDPWERLRLLKQHVRQTPLQMLLRGQSLVGYGHYPDDIVRAFVAKAVENGIDIIRIFDALNDIRNLEVPMQAAKEAGAHVQAAVVYTLSPVHTTEHYLETALQLAQMGADSICIKDMAGLLAPYRAYELVKLLKERLSVPIHLHCHYIGGMAVGAYLKAAEAGVDIIDTAAVPLAFGASQPPVETVVRALKDTPYDTGLDIHLLFEIAQYFENLRRSLGYERGVTRIHDMRVFDHQVPGGMISNLVSQLEEQKALDRLQDVLDEIPRVRAELGYPPLVTPTSQIVGTQAVLNVLTGERYKFVPGEVRNYVQGLYGRPPAPIDPEVAAKILGDKEPITCRPADLLEPRLERMREEIQDLASSEEDVLSYALFPQVTRKFLEARAKGETREPLPVNTAGRAGGEKPKGAPQGKEAKKVNLEEIRELIRLLNETDVTEFSLESQGVKISIKKGKVGGAPALETSPPVPSAATTPPAAPAEPEREEHEENLVTVVAPMVGTFYRAPAPDAPPFVEIGDTVHEGQVLCIIEAMKLMNEIEAEVAGEIVDILVENGQPVEYGQPLFLIKPS
ncbi:MAG: Acetyl-CoA carboxylase, biotin carboxyl carrier protein [Clostridia bacterium 62_21]|nr:MAG: Acetyl-CoA carboxylase, biotin carboxyl carrier protein [Clostridia bacterium 62_21]HAG07255.1 pyruvate carboxylase subunit B [Peptococcaceae bacterium]